MASPIENGKAMLKVPNRGFTLIELVVVMAIIALLLSLALPRYFNHLESARETILKQDLAVMRDAIDKYHGDRGRYPAQQVQPDDGNLYWLIDEHAATHLTI